MAVATAAAAPAGELMFNARASASIYAGAELERCLRDICTAGPDIVVVPANYELVGQTRLAGICAR